MVFNKTKSGLPLVPELGKSYTHTRSFSRADIAQFAGLSGDFGDHHTASDKPVMAQGLLVASIVTKIGGDMNYIAHTMSFSMRRPVYEGQKISGKVTVERLVKTPRRLKLDMRCECFDEKGELVLSGSSQGMVWLQ